MWDLACTKGKAWRAAQGIEGYPHCTKIKPPTTKRGPNSITSFEAKHNVFGSQQIRFGGGWGSGGLDPKDRGIDEGIKRCDMRKLAMVLLEQLVGARREAAVRFLPFG